MAIMLVMELAMVGCRTDVDEDRKLSKVHKMDKLRDMVERLVDSLAGRRAP